MAAVIVFLAIVFEQVERRELCKEVGDNAVNLTDAFGLTDRMLASPAALDWIQYNSYDNQGEVGEFLKNY